MPTFDLRHIRAAKYNHSNGTTTYTNAVEVGDAMAVDLNLRFAEGRLYAESSLAEWLQSATGGTASIGVKYLKDAFQKLAFGMREGTRTVSGNSVPSLKYGTKDMGDYVGFAFFAPDMIDTVQKYTCVLVMRARFGPPSYKFRTKGENYTFNTPTTTGEFLPDLGEDQDLFEIAVVDDAATAGAWVDAAVNYTGAKTVSVTRRGAAPEAEPEETESEDEAPAPVEPENPEGDER